MYILNLKHRMFIRKFLFNDLFIRKFTSFQELVKCSSLIQDLRFVLTPHIHPPLGYL